MPEVIGGTCLLASIETLWRSLNRPKISEAPKIPGTRDLFEIEKESTVHDRSSGSSGRKARAAEAP